VIIFDNQCKSVSELWRGVVFLFLLIALPCAVRAEEGKGDGRGKDDVPSWQVAPDGVLYGDRRCYEAWQQKALSPNLIKNHSFEQGRYWPFDWDPTDGLGIFWVPGGSDGKRCVKLYTDVLDEQWVKWNDKVLKIVEEASKRTGGQPQKLPKNPVPDAPHRAPTAPPYYDTVAGLHGIHYRSGMVKVAPGAIYRVSVDARADTHGEPKVFTKGFFRWRGLMRNAGRAPMTLYGCGKQWKRFARVFTPADWKSTLNDKPVSPEFLQVQLYAYWPVGNYYFDNVRLEIVGYKKLEPARKKARQPAEQPEKKGTPKLGEDEFPVFDP